MNEFTTTTTHCHGGWAVASTTMVDGTDRELTITTAPDGSGAVRCTASVRRMGRELKSPAPSCDATSVDFKRTLLSMQQARVTKKVVQLQHQTALAQAESILFHVRQHYAVIDAEGEGGHEVSAASTPAPAKELV